VIPFERDPEPSPHGWEDLGGRFSGSASDAGRVAVAERRSSRTSRPRDPESRSAWLIGPLLLASVAAGMLFVFRGADHLFGVALGVVMGLGFLWILVSVLFPARPDRTCPRCGNKALERLDPGSTHGLHCRMCHWEDADASSFLYAEEEGTFEDAVLRERGDPPRRW
jgi:hypothetical protein